MNSIFGSLPQGSQDSCQNDPRILTISETMRILRESLPRGHYRILYHKDAIESQDHDHKDPTGFFAMPQHIPSRELKGSFGASRTPPTRCLGPISWGKGLFGILGSFREHCRSLPAKPGGPQDA